MKKTLNKTFLSVACASLSLFGAVSIANAGTASSSEIGVDLAVTAPACSVWNGSSPTAGAGTSATTSATVLLPAVSSSSMTNVQYLSWNGITTAATAGGNWVTSANFNQTATIQCSVANTTITSFVIQPGAGALIATSFGSGNQYMIDAGTTPVKAASGNLVLNFEQVQVNGSNAPATYASPTNGTITPYTTAFSTGALQSDSYSYATVTWRPALNVNLTTAAMGTPLAGTDFHGYAQIVANY